MRLIRGRRRGCLLEISRCRIEVGTGGQEMGVSDGLLKAGNPVCVRVYVLVWQIMSYRCWGRSESFFILLFLTYHSFLVFFSACLELGSETLNSDISWLAVVPSRLSRIHVSIIFIAFGLHHPLAEWQTLSLQRFITSHKFPLPQLKSTKKTYIQLSSIQN